MIDIIFGIVFTLLGFIAGFFISKKIHCHIINMVHMQNIKSIFENVKPSTLVDLKDVLEKLEIELIEERKKLNKS